MFPNARSRVYMLQTRSADAEFTTDLDVLMPEYVYSEPEMQEVYHLT